MSLSAHEKIEFERLTAYIQFDDSDLKKMAKRDRATAMSYVELPSRNTILIALVLINVCLFVSGILTHNTILANVTEAIGGMLTAVVVINSVYKVAGVNPKPTTRK